MAAVPSGGIVLGADYRGLGVARSLGRRGIPVWVIADDDRVAAYSRYVGRGLSWPAGGTQKRAHWLVSLAERCGLDGWALFPTTDVAAEMVEWNRDLLSTRFRLTTAPWTAMRWAHDKRLMYRLAQEAGIDQPTSCWPNSKRELTQLDCAFPVVLKPAIKRGANRFIEDKAWRVDDTETLLQRYDEASTFVEPGSILVQELIPGDQGSLFAFAALCQEGRTVASMVTRSLRQYPLDFGHFSTYVQTVEQNEVEGAGRHLLELLKCTGVVQVQFKRDARDGRFKLLDVNMRVWGSHSLGQAAGIDFPYLLWRMSQGETVPCLRARPGVRWMRFVPDTLAAGVGIRRRTMSLPSYLRSLRPPLADAMFASDDPVPSLVEMPLLLKRKFMRLLAG